MFYILFIERNLSNLILPIEGNRLISVNMRWKSNKKFTISSRGTHYTAAAPAPAAAGNEIELGLGG